MPRVKLNQRFTEQICISLGKKKEEWFDLSIRGFYLEVRETGGKTWRLRLTDQSGASRVVSLGDANCVSFDQAREQARNLRAAAQIGQWQANPEPPPAEALRPSFADFVQDSYLPYASVRKRSVGTDISMLNNHLLPAFGQTRLGELTRDELVRFHIAKRQQGYAPGTVDRMVVLLRFIMNLAVKWRVISTEENPAREFELFNVPNNRERFLSAEEVELLITELRNSINPDLLNIVTTLLLTGCRRGEILKAQWKDIDLERDVFHIPLTKQGRPHKLPLTADLRTFLLGLPSRGKSDWLFPNGRTGKPYQSIFYSWDTARKAAGMPELRIHDLRHSFASFLVNAGRSLYEVQRLLGHTSSRTTQRYAHLSDDALTQAMSAAGGWIKPAPASPA